MLKNDPMWYEQQPHSSEEANIKKPAKITVPLGLALESG